MNTAQEFLTDFVKDIIKHPMERQQLIASWAKHLEAREEAMRQEADLKGLLEAAEQIWGVYAARSRENPSEPMFDFEKWLPGQIQDWHAQLARREEEAASYAVEQKSVNNQPGSQHIALGPITSINEGKAITGAVSKNAVGLS